jgi:signal transduction histidine kinase
MDMLAASIEQSNAVVTSDELPTVQGDRTQLAQLLFNLIGNGIKYNDCHPPKIHISAEPQPNSWRIAVRDNGIGIDPKNQKHIFEISHRLHTQSEYPGTGLGLAICSRVVERHGGRIWVESQLDQGSTFYFELPVKQAK